MSAAIGVFVMVGAAIGSLLIPPHHLFKTKSQRSPAPPDPTISAVDEETR